MLFTSPVFWLFFCVVFCVHWILPGENGRRRWLLLASYVFYGWWDWRFLGLIFLVTFVAYCGAAAHRRWRERERQKTALTAALVCHVFVLAVFKYLGWLSALFSGHASPALNIILPVGVSFYVFQAISFNVDVWRGDLREKITFEKLAFYIAFFPQLVAGPIVRAAQFLPQTNGLKTLETHEVLSALRLIGLGLIYKLLLADNIAPYVDRIFGGLALAGADEKIAATAGFYAQIYFDFAGYTAIAIGLARLLGYRIPKNFNYPYAAASMTAFWRRWHISLSRWLRDYLFIPLGGNRRRYYSNIMVTMLLGGLWHGANLTFLVWGAVHGAALIVHKFWLRHGSGPLPAPVGIALTQAIVFLGWIFFRAQNPGDALDVFSALPLAFASSWSAQSAQMAVFSICAVALDAALARPGRFPALRRPAVCAVAAGGVAALACAVFPLEMAPFIYFRF